ncbi:MAG: PmoA family protein [Planctomycetota bacterium]
MLTPKTFATLAVLFFAAVVSARADTPSYHWKTEKDSLSLLTDEKIVYTYHFAAKEGYPYIHPISLPGGPVMSALAPADHPWHRGLWFSWKFLNGVNYWEFAPNHPNQPDGKTVVVGPAVIHTTETMATVGLRLEYSKAQVVLAEERTLVASRPRLDGSYTIDWTSRFTAKDKDVVFERTPPKQASWGGYGGLGFRASKTMRDFRAIDSEGRVGRTQAHGKQARWMDFGGVFGEQNGKTTTAGITIFDHPANPRHPVSWYLSDDAGLPYFGPALLFAQPMTLKLGDSFTIKYRILIHPGLGDKAALEKEYQAFAK